MVRQWNPLLRNTIFPSLSFHCWWKSSSSSRNWTTTPAGLNQWSECYLVSWVCCLLGSLPICISSRLLDSGVRCMYLVRRFAAGALPAGDLDAAARGRLSIPAPDSCSRSSSGATANRCGSGKILRIARSRSSDSVYVLQMMRTFLARFTLLQHIFW